MSNRKIWHMHKVMRQQWLKAPELEEVIGSSAEVNYAEVQKDDAKHTLADVGLAKKLIGYEPSVNVEEGLKKFVHWYQCKP